MPKLPFDSVAFSAGPAGRLAAMITTLVGTLSSFDASTVRSMDFSEAWDRIGDAHNAARSLKVLVGSGLSSNPAIRAEVASHLAPVFQAIVDNADYPDSVRGAAKCGLDEIAEYMPLPTSAVA